MQNNILPIRTCNTYLPENKEVSGTFSPSSTNYETIIYYQIEKDQTLTRTTTPVLHSKHALQPNKLEDTLTVKEGNLILQMF